MGDHMETVREDHSCSNTQEDASLNAIGGNSGTPRNRRRPAAARNRLSLPMLLSMASESNNANVLDSVDGIKTSDADDSRTPLLSSQESNGSVVNVDRSLLRPMQRKLTPAARGKMNNHMGLFPTPSSGSLLSAPAIPPVVLRRISRSSNGAPTDRLESIHERYHSVQ